MRGVRVVPVGYSDLTTMLPGDALVRVFPAATLWHQHGNLHKITVQGGSVVDSVVTPGTYEYRAGMAAFAEDGD